MQSNTIATRRHFSQIVITYWNGEGNPQHTNYIPATKENFDEFIIGPAEQCHQERMQTMRQTWEKLKSSTKLEPELVSQAVAEISTTPAVAEISTTPTQLSEKPVAAFKVKPAMSGGIPILEVYPIRAEGSLSTNFKGSMVLNYIDDETIKVIPSDGTTRRRPANQYTIYTGGSQPTIKPDSPFYLPLRKEIVNDIHATIYATKVDGVWKLVLPFAILV